jgi:hypothetical protein
LRFVIILQLQQKVQTLDDLFFWCGIESSLYFFVDRTYLIEYSYVGAGWLGMMLIDAFIPQREQLASKPLASTIHSSPYMYDHIGKSRVCDPFAFAHSLSFDPMRKFAGVNF